MDFLFLYIIDHNELNSSAKIQKRRFFLKKNGVVSENKAVWDKNTRKNGRKHFCGYKERSVFRTDAPQRRTVVVFEADEERVATVVPVRFAVSFAFSALS